MWLFLPCFLSSKSDRTEAPLIKKFLRSGPLVPSHVFQPAGIEPPFTNQVNIVPLGTAEARFASSADTLSPIVGPTFGTAGTTTGSILPALVVPPTIIVSFASFLHTILNAFVFIAGTPVSHGKGRLNGGGTSHDCRTFRV